MPIDDSPPPQMVMTKVVGVTSESRQQVIVRLKVGQRLQLRREPATRFDPTPILVLTRRSQAVGYLSGDLVASLAPSIDRGHSWSVTVLVVTGGLPDFPTHGVNLILRRISRPQQSGGSWWKRLISRSSSP